MTRNDVMEVDIRKHHQIRTDVRVGLLALKVQARQIWGEKKTHGARRTTGVALGPIVLRLMKGVGDLAGLARDNPQLGEGSHNDAIVGGQDGGYFYLGDLDADVIRELKKELGNIVFSTVRWIDDLGLDVLECLDLAVEAQEKFANSGKPR